MWSFKKKSPSTLDIFPSKLAKRVSRIPTPELSAWADQSLYEISRCLSGYQRTGQQVFMDEALVGAQALHAVITTMEQRTIKK